MNDMILSKKQVVTITSRSATSLWRDVRAGSFPQPRQVGPGRVGWLQSEVMAWLESRPVVSTNKQKA